MSESPELYVAIGRIEEGMRFVRETQERMEKKQDAQDARLGELELDVKELKTQRDDRNNKFALWIALAAVVIAGVSIFLP